MVYEINNWDLRFMQMAALVASWSKDPSTKCGAIITRANNTIVSTGFNGFPRGVEDCPKILNNREEKYLRTVHAEANAILHSRESLDGCSIYMQPFGPCSNCACLIIQSGISKVFYIDNTTPKRWRDSVNNSKVMMENANIQVITLDKFYEK